MSKEDRARELMLECIQHLQQHPNLEPPMYKSYLFIVYGESLKKCGMTAEQICAERERRSRERTLQGLRPDPIRD
jgi:hypothetical protein